MTALLNSVLYFALLIHMGLAAVVLWRIVRGENDIDRLIGADLISTLALAMLVLLSLIERRSTYIDVALGLAALTSVGTIALAKYLADEQMF